MSGIGPNINRPSQPYQPVNNPGSGQAINANPMPSPLMESMPSPGGNLLVPLGLATLFAAEKALSTAEMVILLRNLLQLPKEFVQMMGMLAHMEEQSLQTLMAALLNENVQIPLEAFQQLLETQSKQSQEKLLKLLQNSPMGFTQSAQQLGDLLQTLSRITNKSSSSSDPQKALIDSLHTSIALYLPYYPLQMPQSFSLRYQPESETAQQSGQSNAALIIFMQTMHLGALKITISASEQHPCHILVEHQLSEISALEQVLHESLQMVNIPAASLLFYHLRMPPLKSSNPDQNMNATQPADPPAKNAEAFSTESFTLPPQSSKKQEVQIMPGQGISAFWVLAAYTLIRTIFEFDLQCNKDD